MLPQVHCCRCLRGIAVLSMLSPFHPTARCLRRLQTTRRYGSGTPPQARCSRYWKLARYCTIYRSIRLALILKPILVLSLSTNPSLFFFFCFCFFLFCFFF